MEAIILSRQHFDAIIEKLDLINKGLKKTNSESKFFLDNKSFNKLMSVSPRTAQLWREQGKIGYSKVGGKIYYRMTDVEKFFSDHYQIHSSRPEELSQSA